jgi:hypothetical protein
MKTFLTAVIATISLSSFSSNALESQHTIASSDMQHYVFTYNFNKTVDPVSKQFAQTSQNLNYNLALDIQGQVYSNLSNIVQSSASTLAMRKTQDSIRFVSE